MLRTILGVLTLASLAGFAGHGHPNFAAHIDKMAARAQSQLQLTAAQQPAFDALVANAKAQATARQAAEEKTHADLRAALQANPVDIDTVTALMKARAHQHANVADEDALIDQVGAFYKTLTPAQQAVALQLLNHPHGPHN